MKGDDFGRVAVLYGGRSAEREVSIETGTAVHAALNRCGVEADLFDTGHRSIMALADAGYDRVFIALHGRGGEDGTIQGALECLGIPYTGSGVLGSALAMDKVRSKQVWQAAGLPTPPFVELRGIADLDRVAGITGFPVMIKPVHEGSSCGATRVSTEDQLVEAWQKASALDDRVLAEAWITGSEYTLGILDRQVLPAIRLETPHEFYDYAAKYTESTTRYICPCGMPAEDEQALQRLVLQAFDALCASGWGRIDMLRDEQGRDWLIELNTVPGMTSHSLVPMAARQAGLDFDSLVIAILRTSLNRVCPAGVSS